jgi:ATP-dependent Clp protease adaptor protein ClpS
VGLVGQSPKITKLTTIVGIMLGHVLRVGGDQNTIGLWGRIFLPGAYAGELKMPTHEIDTSGEVLEETKTREKLKQPPLYTVLLHNDDYTPMEFVVFILQTIFGKNEFDALQIMLNVHRQGIGIAGVYTYEVAETKVAKVTSAAQENEFPLLCTLEEESVS